MTAEEKKKRTMPKGGRKGGAVFPRINLQDAVGYARKLVGKTHVSPQPRDVILSGVVGSKSGLGDVRISALKQYGFLKGDAKSDYSADELAKQITAAPEDELIPLYCQAALKPTVFKKLFETFHGDTVAKAKLKQRSADLKVHPEETETCVELYVSSLALAGLITIEGDLITHRSSSEMPMTPDPHEEGSSSPEEMSEHESITNNNADGNLQTGGSKKHKAATLPTDDVLSGPRAVFNVNVTLDSSLDIEKLQKQLDLLKRYGAI